MTKEELQALQRGDIIRHKHSADSLLVSENYGSYAIAIRTAHVSNAHEWELIAKADHKPEGSGS